MDPRDGDTAADLPSVELLRALATLEGISPTDADLLAAQSYLVRILPQLEELSR